MLPRSRVWLIKYGLAVVSVLLALVLTLLFRPITQHIPFVFFYAALTVSAGYGGFGPGLLSTVLAVLLIDYFFFPPLYSVSFDPIDLLATGLFAITALFISSFQTQRRRAEQMVREQRERYRVTLSSIGDAVIATDTRGSVTFMNPTAETLTGWSQTDAQGMTAQTVFHIVNEQTRQPVENPISQVLQMGTITGLANHTVLITKDGQERPIDDSGAPIKDELGQIVGAVLVFRDISARRQLEADIHHREAQLRLIINTVPTLIFYLDPAQRYRFINDAYADWFGINPSEVVGRYFADVIGETAYRQVLPLLITALGGEPVHFERASLRRDGSTCQIAVTYLPLVGPDRTVQGIVGAIDDITDRKRTEAVQRFLGEAATVLASSLTYQETFNTLAHLLVPAWADNSSVCILQPDGTFSCIAAAARDQVTESAILDIFRRYPLDMMSPDLRTTIQAGEPSIIPDLTDPSVRPAERETALMRTVGTVSLVRMPLHGRDGLLGILSIGMAESGRRFSGADLDFARELTRRAALALDNGRLYEVVQTNAQVLQQTVAERTGELQTALEQARSADRAKSIMMATVTHEMRTPLSSIIGFSNLILTRTLEQEKLVEYAGAINAEGRRLAALINDFLDLQRIEAGRQEFQFRPVDLAALVREEGLGQDLAEPQIRRIRLDCASVPPVLADPERIRQAIRNLLANALKFALEGEITLSVGASERDVIFSIQDRGIGIPTDELGKLFQHFYRGSAAEHQRIPGTGLGLALCRELIEAHKGRIWADSPGPNQGATFSFALPIR